MEKFYGAKRLTPSEYELHLERNGDWEPETTMAQVRAAEGRWTDDAHGSQVAYDNGWFWIRTDALRVTL